MHEHNVAKVGASVLLYWVVAISMTFVNKFLVGSADSADLTLFIGWTQCVSSVMVAMGLVVASRFRANTKPIELSREVCFDTKFVAIGVNFVILLTLNNVCLKYGGVAFFQIAKALTICFVVLLNRIALKKTASAAVILSCAVMIVGFVLGWQSEDAPTNLTNVAVISGTLCSFFTAVNSLLQKAAVDNVEKNKILFTLYENFNASVAFLAPMILLGEFPSLFQSDQAKQFSFWTFLTISGVLAFCIGFAIAWQMQLTSPLTSNISSNCKSVIQTVLAVLIEQKFRGAGWWGANGLVAGGAIMYAYVRYREEEAHRLAAVAKANPLLPVVATNPTSALR